MTMHLTFDGPVATIALDRPGGNRIDFAMRRDLRDAVAKVAASDAKVLVVRGEGADFCRGGDVREWTGVPSGELRPHIEVFAFALRDLTALPIPTLAVVRGGCMGGGFELALACDLIVASEDATFRFPEAGSGILTLQGGVLSLAQRIGRAKALEVAWLTEPLPAATLADWNVVNRVVANDALDATAADMAAKLAAIAPGVCSATKSLMATWQDHGPAAAMDAWYGVSMPIFDTLTTQAALAKTAASLNKSS